MIHRVAYLYGPPVAGLVEVRIEHLEPLCVAVRRHEGPYEGLAGVVDELVRWLKHRKEAGAAVTTVLLDLQSLEAGVPSEHAHVPAHDDTQDSDHDHGEGHAHPESGRAVRAEIWVPAPKNGLGDDDPEGVTIEQIPGVKAACVQHTGDPLALPHIALALRAFLEENGYTLGEETRIVHLMPDWENPSQWVAEVQVPIQDACCAR